MLANYFKMSYRSLFKNKLYGFISVFSLSMAIGAVISIFLLGDIVFNLDTFHANGGNIFQIQNVISRDGEKKIWSRGPAPLGPALKNNFAQIKHSIRVAEANGVMKYKDKVFDENFRFVDDEFFEMFTFPLLRGNKSSIANKDAVILAEEIATKYFGEESPIGKQITITLNDGRSSSYFVQGVAKKFPINAGFVFNILLNYQNYENANQVNIGDWKHKTSATFVQLNDPRDIEIIKSKMTQYIKLQNSVDADWQIEEFLFVPFLDLATTNYEIRDPITISVNPVGLLVFFLIGIFLLMVACINYINIALASTSKRLKEIGIRKVLGSKKWEIVKQFIGENILLCFIALIVGLFLTQILFLPVFSTLGSIPPLENMIFNAHLWLFLPVLLFFTALLSGAYPAFFISSYQPANIFNGEKRSRSKKLLTRISLTLQFIFTFILITFALIVNRNAEYQRNLDWGYNQEHIIVVPLSDKKQFDLYKNEIVTNPHIINIAGANQHIGKGTGTAIIEIDDKKFETRRFEVGTNYLETMGVRLKDGRFFNPDLITDRTQSVIVNEQFVKNLSLKDPIGTYISINNLNFLIIGVVENFHYRNFMSKIEPVVIHLSEENNFNYLIAKIEKGISVQTFEQLKEKWKQLLPDKPNKAFYQDQVFESYFQGEEKISKLFFFFAFIALIISCMGLFGLASVNIANQTKEIAVRKVLGAEKFGLIKLINKQFVILLLIAMIIATPLAYQMTKSVMDAMHGFHLPITTIHFIFTSIIILFTAILTTSSLIYRAACINPAEALKYE